MQHDQIIKTLESLIPKGVEQGPENVLLKYANDSNLAPAQLERLAQMYNVAMTLNFMDKSANRGASFTVIDVPDLLSKFTDPTAKEAAVPSDWSDWFDTTPMSKAASTFTEADSADDFLSLARGIEKEASELVFTEDYETYDPAITPGFWSGIAKEAADKFEQESVAQIIHDAEEDFRKAASAIEYLVRTGADFKEMAIEAQSLHSADGVKAASALHGYLKHTGLVGDTCAEGTVRIVKDTWKSSGLFKAAAVALNEIEAATKYASRTYKMNARGPGKNVSLEEDTDDPVPNGRSHGGRRNPQRSTKGGPSKGQKVQRDYNTKGGPSKNQKLQSDNKGTNTPKTKSTLESEGGGGDAPIDFDLYDTQIGNKVETPRNDDKETRESIKNLFDDAGTGLSGVADPDTYLQGMTFDSHLDKLKGLGSGKNKTQKSIDTAAEDTQGVTTVQRLMMTDPIISKADPQLVISLTNTLAKASPQVRNDPNLLRMALREAIQYEAIPMHTFKDLIEMEQRSQATTDLKTKNDSAKYSI